MRVTVQCQCGSCAIDANDEKKIVARSDPTGTAKLRRAFAAAIDIRWRSVRSQVRAGVEHQFQIQSFGPDSEARVASFSQWIEAVSRLAVVDAGVIRQYVGRAYERGLSSAMSGSPSSVIQSSLPALLGLAAHELGAIQTQVAQAAGRAFASALIGGWSVARLTREIKKVIDDVGVARSRLATDSLIVRAYNEAILDALQARGETHVGVVPETVRRPRVGDAKRTGPGSRVSRKRTPSRSTIRRIRQAEQETERWARGRRVNVETAEDDRVCPVCEQIAEDGPYTIDRARGLIPAHVRCFLPGTRVSGQFVAGVRSHYHGAVVDVTTSRGYKLSVTGNHPVLTASGLVAAKHLSRRDQLVSDRRQIWGSVTSLVNSNNNDMPVLVEEVFNTLRRNGVRSVNPSSDDLHGDAISVHGKIDIVYADSRLMSYFDATSSEKFNEIDLKGSDVALVDFLVESTSGETIDWDRLAASSVVRRPDLLRSLFGGHAGPLQFFRSALGSENLAGGFESAVDSPSAYSEFLRELVRAHDTVVLDDIVELSVREYDGHVYDLQSSSGYLIAGGVYASNCRCLFVPVPARASKSKKVRDFAPGASYRLTASGFQCVSVE